MISLPTDQCGTFVESPGIGGHCGQVKGHDHHGQEWQMVRHKANDREKHSGNDQGNGVEHAHFVQFANAPKTKYNSILIKKYENHFILSLRRPHRGRKGSWIKAGKALQMPVSRTP